MYLNFSTLVQSSRSVTNVARLDTYIEIVELGHLVVVIPMTGDIHKGVIIHRIIAMKTKIRIDRTHRITEGLIISRRHKSSHRESIHNSHTHGSHNNHPQTLNIGRITAKWTVKFSTITFQQPDQDWQSAVSERECQTWYTSCGTFRWA